MEYTERSDEELSFSEFFTKKEQVVVIVSSVCVGAGIFLAIAVIWGFSWIPFLKT